MKSRVIWTKVIIGLCFILQLLSISHWLKLKHLRLKLFRLSEFLTPVCICDMRWINVTKKNSFLRRSQLWGLEPWSTAATRRLAAASGSARPGLSCGYSTRPRVATWRSRVTGRVRTRVPRDTCHSRTSRSTSGRSTATSWRRWSRRARRRWGWPRPSRGCTGRRVGLTTSGALARESSSSGEQKKKS